MNRKDPCPRTWTLGGLFITNTHKISMLKNLWTALSLMIQNSNYQNPKCPHSKLIPFEVPGSAFPQLIPSVLESKSNCMQILLMKSKTETVLDCKEEVRSTGTYIREKTINLSNVSLKIRMLEIMHNHIISN